MDFPSFPSNEVPFVTVIMPVRDEADFIERSLGAVLNQQYPASRMEVLIADGMSVDGTRDLIQQMIDAYPEDERPPAVRILDNHGQTAPAALNVALGQMEGDIILRVDGHCEIAPDYLENCVAVLEKTRAACVGGPMVTVGESVPARAISLAQSAVFGVGTVAFRTGREEAGYVDTVPFMAYRREVFDQIGLFDEELVRNQDDEFNFRLLQAGGRIWMDPSIRSVYYCRSSFRKLWRQYYQYGVYKVRLIQKRGAVPSWRQLVPGAFVFALMLSVLLALITNQPLWMATVAGPYLVANLAFSFWTARKDGVTLPLLPLCFAILHLSYGLGFLWGFWRWRKHGIPSLRLGPSS